MENKMVEIKAAIVAGVSAVGLLLGWRDRGYISQFNK